MELEKKFEDYLIRHKKSADTISIYLSQFRQFRKFIGESSPETITVKQVYDYLSFILNDQKSPSSAQQARASLDIVFNKVLNKNFAIKSFKLTYRKRSVKVYLTEEEIKGLLDSISNLKLKCAIGLMYSARLSVGEAVDLRITDIDFKNKIITVRQTKNNRLPRKVALSDYIAEYLVEYLKRPHKTTYIFERKSGLTKNATDWLQRGFKRALPKAGITKKVTTNTLLDSYIIHLQAQGVPLYQILKEQNLSVGTNLTVYSVLLPTDKKIHSPLDPIMQGTYRQLSENTLITPYVSLKRIIELENCKSDKFDLQKLIQMCRELNNAYTKNSFFTIGILVRAIIDHVPPIFNKLNFSEVAGSYSGGKSFSDEMKNLDAFSRKIADRFLHGQIRNKEVLPTFNQVNFSNALDSLLGEIVRMLK